MNDLFVKFVFVLTLVSHSYGFVDEKACLENPKVCLADVPNLLTRSLANQHLVMVGDSITRYQYLSLVYALRHQNLLSSVMQPNLVEEMAWNNWPNFYQGSTSILAPYEVCDCARTQGAFSDAFENRYYHDPHYNITVTFFSFIADISQGRIRVNEHRIPEVAARFPVSASANRTPEWHYDQFSLDKFFTEQVAPLVPKPTAVVFNYGKWMNKLSDGALASIMFSVFNFVDIFIWKTTTAGVSTPDDVKIYEHDQDVQFSQIDILTVMNTSWTKSVNTTHRWDNIHFREPVYSLLNYQMIDLIAQKRKELESENQ